MNALVSVIVPIYNVEAYLDRCIQSIFAQTYKNLEIILVDDGSPDRCPELCDQYAKSDVRVMVIHKKNGGLSDARNYGIEQANGEYIVFVDSDDYIEPELCSECLKRFESDKQIDIVSFEFRRVTDSEQGGRQGTGNIRVYDNFEGFRSYINRDPFTHMVCDKMFRHSLFEDVRFIPKRLAEDLAISYRLIGKARKICHLDRVFYNYFYRESSIMGQKSLKLELDAYQGECEAYQYGNKNYPALSCYNKVRFLNQSMKTYLKLLKLFPDKETDYEKSQIMKSIQNMSKEKLPLKTKAFYTTFQWSKDAAWMLFKMFHLS